MRDGKEKMLFKLLPISLLQCALLICGQILMKYGLVKAGEFSWSMRFFYKLFINWQFICCGISFAVSSILWMYIIKKFPFSMAYPMISLSYVMGMFAAIIFFHEHVPFVRWVGVAFILLGCILIAR